MVDANSQFLYATDHATYAKRHYLSQFLREKTDSIVQHGILKGFQIGPCRWAEAAVGSYLLGTYEVHVCALLERLAYQGRILVDIGAADGLFGVGLVSVGAFDRSICFEADEISNEGLRQLSSDLGLADRVTVHGKAEAESMASTLGESVGELDGAVVICDIEGAEFGLLTRETLESLKKCHVIVETHDFLMDGDCRESGHLSELIHRAEEFFHVHIVKDGLRYTRDIPLLEDWRDADVWSICMEGRKMMMTWLYLVPLSEKRMTHRKIDQLIYKYQLSMFG